MTDTELTEYTEFANELPGGQRSAMLRLVAEVEHLTDQLARARRLLSVCTFDAPEDKADYDAVME